MLLAEKAPSTIKDRGKVGDGTSSPSSPSGLLQRRGAADVREEILRIILILPPRDRAEELLVDRSVQRLRDCHVRVGALDVLFQELAKAEERLLELHFVLGVEHELDLLEDVGNLPLVVAHVNVVEGRNRAHVEGQDFPNFIVRLVSFRQLRDQKTIDRTSVV